MRMRVLVEVSDELWATDGEAGSNLQSADLRAITSGLPTTHPESSSTPGLACLISPDVAIEGPNTTVVAGS
jgi:hypothetical protein